MLPAAKVSCRPPVIVLFLAVVLAAFVKYRLLASPWESVSPTRYRPLALTASPLAVSDPEVVSEQVSMEKPRVSCVACLICARKTLVLIPVLVQGAKFLPAV